MYRVFMFVGCELSNSTRRDELAEAIKICETSKAEKFEVHQVGPYRDWDHYMFGEKRSGGHIDWRKIPWRRM